MYVLNLSSCLPDPLSECRFRLLFNGSSWIDFAGFDTSAESSVAVHEGELVSVTDYSGIDATFGDLSYDDGVCARLRYGFDIDLSFRLPELNDSGLRRDFIFVAKGYYSERTDQMLGGMGESGGTGHPVDMNANWKDWFEKIENCCRTMGWVWANVAGYSFYYFGNTAFWSLMGPAYDPCADQARQSHEDGLKQFLDRDVACNTSCDGHVAKRSHQFSISGDGRGAFDTSEGAYDDLPNNVSASRPLVNTDLSWDITGYVDMNDTNEAHITSSIAMNGEEPGLFVHSGLAAEASDWMKGYVATALAIEEARPFLKKPTTSTWGGKEGHAATFSVTTLAGGWGTGDGYFRGVHREYRYVDLVLTIPSHFVAFMTQNNGIQYVYELSVADFKLSGTDTEIWASIDLAKSGWETGTQDRGFMDDLALWWTVDVGTDTLSMFIDIPYLGSLISLIPILTGNPQPHDLNSFNSSDMGVYARGTPIDPNNDNWGTVCMYFRVFLLKSTLPREYAFTINMISSIQETIIAGGSSYNNPRWESLTNATQLSFEVVG
jgi:hypothetical protein